MKRFIKWLALFVLLFALFRYLAFFSDRQSLLMAFILVGLYERLSELAKQKQVPFVPYSLFIRPNYHTILIDFGLLKDAKDNWAELWDAIRKLPKKPWNIWETGLSISFVTPSLKYRPAWNDFMTKVDLYASLEPVVTLREHLDREVNPYIDCPSLQLLPGNYGYRLILKLPIWYWQKLEGTDLFRSISKLDVSTDQMCGTVEVVIAIIPYQEFDVHFSFYDAGGVEKYTKTVQARAEARSRYGWKGQSKQDIYGNETSAEFSNELEHRYCTVWHSDL
jgi:hypothetical protein